MSDQHCVIVGGGYTGLTAAYELSKQNIKVTVIEADKQLGGLAGTFELSPGIMIEKFYHHWFGSDVHILDLIKEIGLGDKIQRNGTNTGLYYANSIFRLASPFDLLRFTPLPLIDRIRTGLMALRARSISDWKELEDMSAADWIRKYAGKKSFEVIWQPLIHGKFGREAENISAVWFWNKIKLRGSSRDDKGREELLYFEGGFGAVTKGFEDTLRKQGVEIITNTPVNKIISSNGAVSAVEAGGKTIPCSAALAAIPIPIFTKMTPDLPQNYVEQVSKIRYLGNICLVLRLNRSLSNTYWLNVSDPSFPFVGVIEHTNMDPVSNYAGEHVAYISKYLATDEPLFALSDKEYFEYCLPYIKKIFPDFSESWLNGFNCWRAQYSQPVITKHYSSLIPDVQTPIKNLWLATMAQIYPEDRGTNYAVREGRAIGKLIASKL